MNEENKINQQAAEQPAEHTEPRREQAELNSIISAISQKAEKSIDGTKPAQSGKERRCKQCGGKINPATGKCAACGKAEEAKPVQKNKVLLATLAGLVLAGLVGFLVLGGGSGPDADHVHDYTYGTVVEPAATCTTDGKEKQLCSCGAFAENLIPATGHKITLVSTKEATCSGKGEQISKCETCGESFTEYTPALSHQYTAVVTQEPTCSVNGVKTISCAGCGDSYTESVAKVAHTYMDATCTTPKMCTGCWATQGSALGHDGVGVCTRCGITLIPSIVSGGNLQQYASGGDLVPYN